MVNKSEKKRVQAGTTSGQLPSRKDFLKGLAAAGVAAGAYTTVFSPRAEARRTPGGDGQPNIVFIFADDLGWSELGSYGNTFNETPRLDELARRGIRFTDAYSAAPICSPTRASTLTGKYTPRTGITDFLDAESAPSNRFLDPSIITLPERLGDAGYTSALIGKWHQTEDYSGEYTERPGNPYSHGFDEVVASETKYIGDGDYFYPYFFMPELQGEEGEYLTDRLNQEAVDFVTAHADGPFFLYLSHYAVHTTLSAKEELVEKYRNKPGAGEDGNSPVLAAMLESVDEGVGMIVDKLEELGIAENTLVMFMSDNGGEPKVTSNAPLHDGKAELYEGGIRVPLIANRPGFIEAGRTSHVPVHSVDLFPTMLELAGIEKDGRNTLDGLSMAPLLSGTDRAGRSAIARRDALYWLFPEFNPAHASTPQAAVRSGNYKLIQRLWDGRLELYDLERDLGETKDLIEEEPKKAAELHRMLTAFIEEMPVPPSAPARKKYPVVGFTDDFRADREIYTTLAPPPERYAGDTSISGGVLRASGDAPYFGLLRTDVTVRQASATVLHIESFAGAQAGSQDTVYVGLIRDELNYVVVWHDNRLKKTGWDVVQGGKLTTGNRVTGNRVGLLDGKVDLSAPDSTLAFVLDGTAFSAFASSGGGEQRFLFSADVEDVVDLDDPSVLGQYRYGFGVRGDNGQIVVDRFEALVRNPGRS